MRAEAADLVQQGFIMASRLRPGGLITSLCHTTLSSPGPPPCCYTGPSVCHFPLLHTLLQSSVSVSVRLLCASRDGGGGWVRGSGRIHCSMENNTPFDASHYSFFSVTRTNWIVADRRRMKFREGKREGE